MWFWHRWRRWRDDWDRRLFSAGIIALLTGHVVLYLLQHRESGTPARRRQEAPLWGRIFRSGKERGR